MMRTAPSSPMRSQALGAKGGVAAALRPSGRWNPMTRPAPTTEAVCRNSRRVTWVAMSHPLCRAMDGGADALVGAAAADVGHRRVDVGVAGPRLLRQQRRGRHDLTRLTVPALRDVFRDPGALDFVDAVRRQALDGGDAFPGDRGNRKHARARGGAVEVHGA